MASPITYKRLVLSGDKAKETAKEVKEKLAKDWKNDYPDAKLDIKDGVEGKIIIDVKTKDSSAAAIASKIKDAATRNKVKVVLKDKPTLKPLNKEIKGSIIAMGSNPITYNKPSTKIATSELKLTNILKDILK